MIWLVILASAVLFSIFGAIIFTFENRINLPISFAISSCFIIASSYSMNAGVNAEKRLNFERQRYWLWITLSLGALFFMLQLYSWLVILQLVGATANLKLYIIMLTCIHLLHVLGGMIMIVYTLNKQKANIRDIRNVMRLETTAIFWHFIGGLWIYIYLLMLIGF
ncbi:cytochrome c oxidase subunit 3 [Pedobacter sandarakinus]|uniref:cytochrome c oxidase subunit 3 n=1 Tax=Pedobacter sandarakinus TaxID=353156 RepID=UPI0022466582|nr:hypothetical protein [Pedobacter sandarakinus]MCX2574181.1 hypothetical protein [Pedobacter sandarakinus]